MFAVRAVSDEGTPRSTFLGDDSLFHEKSVRGTIELPDGAWELAARPAAGWAADTPLSAVILIGGAILALILTIATYIVVSAPSKLQQQVRERTSELTCAGT